MEPFVTKNFTNGRCADELREHYIILQGFSGQGPALAPPSGQLAARVATNRRMNSKPSGPLQRRSVLGCRRRSRYASDTGQYAHAVEEPVR